MTFPSKGGLIEKMAQAIRIVNLDYIVDTNHPQETLSGSKDLAEAALQALIGSLPELEYTYSSVTGKVIRNNATKLYEQLISYKD